MKELRAIEPVDRLSGHTVTELFAAAAMAHGRRAVKVKLFDYGDPDMQVHERAAFEAGLQSNAISFVRHPQYKGQDVYTATCKTEGDVGFLSGILSVRSIGLIPMFRTLRESRMNSRPLPEGALCGETEPAFFPDRGGGRQRRHGRDSGLGTLDVHPRTIRGQGGREYLSRARSLLDCWCAGHVLNPGQPRNRAASVPHPGYSCAAQFGPHLWCRRQHH